MLAHRKMAFIWFFQVLHDFKRSSLYFRAYIFQVVLIHALNNLTSLFSQTLGKLMVATIVMTWSLTNQCLEQGLREAYKTSHIRFWDCIGFSSTPQAKWKVLPFLESAKFAPTFKDSDIFTSLWISCLFSEDRFFQTFDHKKLWA